MTVHADATHIDPTQTATTPPFAHTSVPPAASSPPVDPLAVGALVAALPAPPVGLALGIVALCRLRTGQRRGAGLAVAGVVVGGLLTVFWAFVATLMIVGIIVAAGTPAADPATTPAPATAPAASSPTPAGDTTDPGVVPAAQIERQLALATGLTPSAISCPAALPARVGAVQTCRATAPAGPVDVLVSVTSVHGDDVDLHYDAGPAGT
jgi:hypothetical protein